MDLRREILKEHSKAQCDRIVNWVGDSQARFDELFRLFLEDEPRVTQRAAWPVSYCVSAHPAFINKHWSSLVKYLQKPNLHNAVKRNGTRLLQYVVIPKRYQGEFMNICFDYLASPTETVAVKVFSLAVLGELSREYPEIEPEIKLLIENQLATQTPGFKSMAKKILEQFGS